MDHRCPEHPNEGSYQADGHAPPASVSTRKPKTADTATPAAAAYRSYTVPMEIEPMLAYLVNLPGSGQALLTPTAFRHYRSIYTLENRSEPKYQEVYTKPGDRVISLLDLLSFAREDRDGPKIP